jgi:hypothetical protein
VPDPRHLWSGRDLVSDARPPAAAVLVLMFRSVSSMSIRLRMEGLAGLAHDLTVTASGALRAAA